MKKSTVESPANIAFIKYWGHKPGDLYLPYNSSISMNLSSCITTTTASVSDDWREDLIEIQTFDGNYVRLDTTSLKGEKAYDQIKRIRNLAKSKQYVHIKTRNSFPSDAGIASSASGFSALTASLLLVYELGNMVQDTKELSRQIRLAGSGSAARSALGGFVELLPGNTHEESYAIQIADEHHWDLIDIIAIINSEKKEISSSEGHLRAESNPYFRTRLQEMKPRVAQTREAIKTKDIEKLGECIEADTLSMHAVMMTSHPPALYWEPGTISIIKEVIGMRNQGVAAYFSIDAGANVHVIAEQKSQKQIHKILSEHPFVENTLINKPAPGVHEVSEHLW